MENETKALIKPENKARQYETKKFKVSIRPNHLWFMRWDNTKKMYAYGVDAKWYLFVSQEMGVKWLVSRDPRQYQDRQDPKRKDWEIKAEYYSRSGELVRDVCTVTMDIMALREKLRASWKLEGNYNEETKSYDILDEASKHFALDPKTREPYFNLPMSAELEIHKKILNMLDHIEKKLETIAKRRIMQNALSEVPRNICLNNKPDKMTGMPILAQNEVLTLEYDISVNRPVFSSQELIEMNARTQKELYNVDLDPELIDVTQSDEQPALVEGTQTAPSAAPEEKPANPPLQQEQKPPENKKTEQPKNPPAATNGSHPCVKCKGATTRKSGNKKSGEPWVGYKCQNPKCQHMEFED